MKLKQKFCVHHWYPIKCAYTEENNDIECDVIYECELCGAHTKMHYPIDSKNELKESKNESKEMRQMWQTLQYS